MSRRNRSQNLTLRVSGEPWGTHPVDGVAGGGRSGSVGSTSRGPTTRSDATHPSARLSRRSVKSSRPDRATRSRQHSCNPHERILLFPHSTRPNSFAPAVWPREHCCSVSHWSMISHTQCDFSYSGKMTVEVAG